MHSLPTIYIGYDPRDEEAYKVLVESILDFSSKPVNIIPIFQEEMRRIGFYRRETIKIIPNMSHSVAHSQNKEAISVDTVDKKPFSTEFSFTRFLVPFLNRHQGYALFMDCDMMVRSDITEVFDYPLREDKAIWCVQHNHSPTEHLKMDNKAQTQYSRKNWSSFVLWNCGHEAHKYFSVDDVNLQTGWYLHNFKWISDHDIGSLPEEWNWLDGHSSPDLVAKNVHFTTGGPWFKNWKAKTIGDAKYALEWDNTHSVITIEESLGKEKNIEWK